jgi:uncharacterized protein
MTTLDDHRYMQLVTFRRSGAGVETPVWFAAAGSRLYVHTEDPSGKVRRIRRDPRCEVGPCSLRGRALGPRVAARARILPPDDAAAAERVLAARYGLGRRLFMALAGPVFRWRGRREVYLEIVADGQGGAA